MKSRTRHLVGRDSAKGRVAFKTVDTLTRKDKAKNRKSKVGQRELRRQLKGE